MTDHTIISATKITAPTMRHRGRVVLYGQLPGPTKDQNDVVEHLGIDQGVALVDASVSNASPGTGGGVGAAAPASTSVRINYQEEVCLSIGNVKEVYKFIVSDSRTAAIRKWDNRYPKMGRGYPKVTCPVSESRTEVSESDHAGQRPMDDEKGGN